PFVPFLREMDAEGGLAHYAANGPRGMALVPTREAARLEGIELPDQGLYDRVHAIDVALQAHDRPRAEAIRRELDEVAPGHRLAILAARTVAAYDADGIAMLAVTDRALARFPDDENVQLERIVALDNLARRDERL